MPSGVQRTFRGEAEAPADNQMLSQISEKWDRPMHGLMGRYIHPQHQCIPPQVGSHPCQSHGGSHLIPVSHAFIKHNFALPENFKWPLLKTKETFFLNLPLALSSLVCTDSLVDND